MPEATTVYLLRHAHSAADPALPESQWPLSDKGRAQALALVPFLQALSIDHVFSSPFPRAAATVRPFATESGLPITEAADLRERLLSTERLDDFLSVLRRTWADFDFALPGAESSAVCQTRVCRAVEALVQRHSGRVLLLASHGNAIGLFLNALDPAFGFDRWRALQNPDLFRIRYRDGVPTWDRSFAFSPADL